MFWVDKVVEEIKQARGADIASGETLIIRDEKTASGRVHVGSMRGVAIHGIVSEALRAAGVSTSYLYEINDFDPMDGLPNYLDAAVYTEHMGKSLLDVPSPDGIAKNFPEYYGQEFEKVITDTGYSPSFYRASTLYLQGRMNEVIQLALDRAALIRDIYKEVSGSVKPTDWHPLNVICENCGKIGTTRVSSWDGKQVTYTCEPEIVKWAKGCGHTGTTTPFDGRAILPWKVEWAAKWRVMNVAIEGAGKDHGTRGGSRQVAERISREVFAFEPPFDIPYEFFLVGGAKMSSSKGKGSSAREVADLFPPHIFRLQLTITPMRAINLEPEGETLPILFDTYDKFAQKYWSGEKDDDARHFELVHFGNPPEQHFLPRFSTVAFLCQIPYVSMEEEFAKAKGAGLSDIEKAEIEERARYARHWLQAHAPERYKFELQKEVPDAARSLDEAQKKSLEKILAFLQENPQVSGEDLHAKLHEIRKETDLEPAKFFSSLYLSILGKESGPQAGWFLSKLDRNFLLTRLAAVIND